jgi:glycosyltransferase involved in cell wall biosynthesis
MISRVTICMTVFSEESDVGGVIQCILDQTFENFELEIVDNASTDR